MKRNVTLLAAIIFCSVNAFSQTNLQFLGQKTYTESLSDIWGYAAGGKEYALVGVYDGFSIVDVTNPALPVELHFIAGPGTIWRDIKVWGQYAYVVNEASDGLLIVDLSGLPATETHTWWTGGALNFTTAHNIYIDENGFGYLMGIPDDDGYYVIDLNTNPTNPVHTGTFDQAYVHDGFVRGDTMWAGLIYNGLFAVIDVSDKANPDNVLATNATPTNFCHNTWMTDDNNYLFTTDELSDAWIGSFDVSDLTNIQQLDVYRSNPGSGVIPHNAFVLGDFVLISYYNDGVVVLDVTNPANMVEVANYDTSPVSGDGYDGCWGVYPYLPSGNILATDVLEGLYVLGNNYTQGCYLEGSVTDSSTGFPLNAADIEILLTPAQTTTAITGFYSTGVASAGTYAVEVGKAGYLAKTVSGVSLSNGVTVTLDVELVPLIPFQLNGKVVNAQTGQGIPLANVKIENQDFTFDLLCDGQGNFTIPTFYQGSYDLYGGKWGYVTQKITSGVNNSSGTFIISINQGYYDDYIMDFGWVVSGDAPQGIWERGEPDGTSFQGMDANPDLDHPTDFGEQCFVTGNAGGSAGTDDVDDGQTVLGSPMMDLSGYTDPYIHYSRWFANGGGFGGPPNDSLVIQIHNGSVYEVLEVITAITPGMSQWNQVNHRVVDFLSPTNQVNILLTASDRDNSGHIVEAAIDLFYVTEGPPGVNTAPVAIDDNTSTDWDTPISIDVQNNDSDPEENPLSTSVLTQPSSGTVSVNGDGSVTYFPVSNFSGMVSFTYEICDNGILPLCDQAEVTVTVHEPSGIGDFSQPQLYLEVSPNPFSESVNVFLHGPYKSNTSLLVYNISGELFEEIQIAPGKRMVRWGEGHPAGVYFIVLTGGTTQSPPMRVLKTE